jgi:hypothetical protein
MHRLTRTAITALAASSLAGCLADDGELDLETAESEVVVDGPFMARGTGGRPFHTSNWTPDDKLVSIQVRSGAEIDGLIVRYASGRVEQFGGTGGRLNPPFYLEDGEELSWIGGWSGNRIDSIRFATTLRRESEYYGGGGGDDHWGSGVPANGRVLGFHGRAGSRIDNIALVWDGPGDPR